MTEHDSTVDGAAEISSGGRKDVVHETEVLGPLEEIKRAAGELDVEIVDDPPPEHSVTTVEGDLETVAELGGFGEEPDAANPGDLVEAGEATTTVGTDRDAIERAGRWLADHPAAVEEAPA